MNLQLATLKSHIIGLAFQGKALRRMANKVHGSDRHALKERAKAIGAEARVAILAYGYLRGRLAAQMESPNSRTPLCPSSISSIIAQAMECFSCSRQEGEQWNLYFARSKETRANLEASIRADLEAWNKMCLKNRDRQPNPSRFMAA